MIRNEVLAAVIRPGLEFHTLKSEVIGCDLDALPRVLPGGAPMRTDRRTRP